MSDSMRLAKEADAAPAPLRMSLKTSAAIVLAGALGVSGFVLGCGPSDSGGYYGSAGSSAGAYYGGAGTCTGTTGCGPASGAYSGTAGTFTGSAGGTGASGGGFDAGTLVATDGAVPPMVVEVDPNGTLSATPGLGVGVFTQYVSGGHWLVWWTCDTEVTGQSCAFTISITPVQGTVSNVQGIQNGTTAAVAGASPSGFALTSNTSTARNQVSFDAQPGASIELDAFVEPSPNENYLFFVQNQRVNGGYQGDLTDPLILEPSSP